MPTAPTGDTNTDRYRIKSGYVANTDNLTLDREPDTSYWTPARIRKSLLYQHHAYSIARQLLRERGLKRVLDVGCGPATKLMRHLAPHAEVTHGIDQPSAVELCRQRYPGRAEFFATDLEQPDLDLPHAYDLIVCADVIEHLLAPEHLLRFIRDNAAPSACVLFSTPERDVLRGPECQSCPKPEHVREWNRDEFVAFLEGHGLAVERTRLIPHMKFNLSREYLRKLRNRDYPMNHTLLAIATPA